MLFNNYVEQRLVISLLVVARWIQPAVTLCKALYSWKAGFAMFHGRLRSSHVIGAEEIILENSQRSSKWRALGRSGTRALPGNFVRLAFIDKGLIFLELLNW